MTNINCPRCDKTFTDDEMKLGKCKCGLTFKITPETDLEVFQEDVMLKRFAAEVAGTKKRGRIEYYEKTIEFIKGYFTSTVCIRREKAIDKCCRNITFYLVDDCEIRCFLFRLLWRDGAIYVDFDMELTGLKDVKVYRRKYPRDRKHRKIKSYLRTTNFVYAMELLTYIYERKLKQLKTDRLNVKLGKSQIAGLAGTTFF